MTKHVLDVGNCGPDHSALRGLIETNFDARVKQAHCAEEAMDALRSTEFALVLVNRKLDADYSDGIEIIRTIKSDPELSDIPVMLITNFEEHQESAVAVGAVKGFGKAELSSSHTLARLEPYL